MALTCCVPLFVVVLLTPSTDTSILAVWRQCWRTGSLTASLTNIHRASHSWEEQKRDFPPDLCPYTGGSKCQCHTGLWGLRCFLHLWSHSSSWRTHHSSAGDMEKYNPLLGDSWSWKNRLDTSTWGVSKLGGHLENYTPWSSQKPEVFSAQTAELIQPSLKLRSYILGTQLGWKWYQTQFSGHGGILPWTWTAEITQVSFVLNKIKKNNLADKCPKTVKRMISTEMFTRIVYVHYNLC